MYGYYLQNSFFIHLASSGVNSNDGPTDEHTRCMTYQKKWNKQTRKKKERKKRANVKKKKRSKKKKKETGGNNESMNE